MGAGAGATSSVVVAICERDFARPRTRLITLIITTTTTINTDRSTTAGARASSRSRSFGVGVDLPRVDWRLGAHVYLAAPRVGADQRRHSFSRSGLLSIRFLSFSRSCSGFGCGASLARFFRRQFWRRPRSCVIAFGRWRPSAIFSRVEGASGAASQREIDGSSPPPEARSANLASAGSDFDPVLFMIEARWFSTVRWLMPRSAAMFLLGWPASTLSITSRCRGVRPTR